MRFKNLEIKAWGNLIDRSFRDLPEGIVVVYGCNESGKSTLFNVFTTLLYGFYPVADFPYRPWEADLHPEVRTRSVLDDGTMVEIWRKLMSTPNGSITRGNEVTELANRDLSVVQHVSRALYKALYALTQSNLKMLAEEERQEIEDRLLGGLGATLLRPTREAI
ncbi:MAG: AAA family ATPase, partial [Planctomycetes bacterium]|nr:AAA family ATPase [Planctomycetota bacterium]